MPEKFSVQLEKLKLRNPSFYRYMATSIKPSPFMVLFLFLFVYSYLKTSDIQGITVLLVVIVAAMVLLRSPR